MRKPDPKTAAFHEAANKSATTGTTTTTTSAEERPFPWNVFSDSTYYTMGLIILFFIIIPSMSVIVLANIAGYFLYKYLYAKNGLGRSILEAIRGTQRKFFHYVGHFILLDPRDSSYLTWMTWGVLIQPALFYWVWMRYESIGGRLEVSVFLLYHLLRVGPRHQLFAHHATLVHKEGHANRNGLFCNPFVVDRRQMLPKPLRRLFADHINAGIAGLFYGTIPNHYATAHNKIVSACMYIYNIYVPRAFFPLHILALSGPHRFVLCCNNSITDGTTTLEMFTPIWIWTVRSLVPTFCICLDSLPIGLASLR